MTDEADGRLFIGRSGEPEYLELSLANRHGLITGATGTGKTVTLQVLAEGFSAAGVPVFCADVKGDLSGIAEAGSPKDFLLKRAAQVGLEDYAFAAQPTIFWDLFGEQGHPIRTTVSQMGPLLLARLLELSEAQEGALNIAFRLADEEGLLLLDLKDLRALLQYIAERGSEVTTSYGNITRQTIGAIQRRLLVLENQGGAHFFGEPEFDIEDLMRVSRDGRGYVSVLAADRLMSSPRLYATFLLWMLSELFERLPEVGDPERPKLVFFFDEAHLLFSDAPAALVEKVEQVVRLIRSKGVGVYFVTQNPLDVPEKVLAQLGNRIQHALRAYTPREQKAVRTAADTFRPNPDFDTARVITELGVGEALVSTLRDRGVPSMVQRTLVRPPVSRLGPITPQERAALLATSPVRGLYDTALDRESAYEMLEARARQRHAEVAAESGRSGAGGRSRTDTMTGLPKEVEDIGISILKSFGRSLATALGRKIGEKAASSTKRRATTTSVRKAVESAPTARPLSTGARAGAPVIGRGVLGSPSRIGGFGASGKS